MAIPGRVEAKFTVPAGVTVEAATCGQSSAITCTVPAGDYYASGLLAALHTQLNDNVQGYPTTAAQMAAAVGYGTWSAGWLFNETSSGTALAAFGGVNLSLSGTPTQNVTGFKGGIDKAVTVTTGNGFSGGANYDVSAADDLIIAWVAKLDTDIPSGSLTLVSKGVGGAGYQLYYFRNSAVSAGVALRCSDGTDILYPTSDGGGASLHVGKWHVGIAVVDRVRNVARLATQALDSGLQVLGGELGISAVGSMSNANSFTVGLAGGLPLNIAALYIGKGSNVATGLSANLATAVSNLANAISASWSCTLDSTTGRVSVGYSPTSPGIPSFSLDWTSTALRGQLGFARDLNYPATAADMAAIVRYGTWTGGWLCNEPSGNLSPAFGGSVMTAISTPTYGHVGPRGGTDKAIAITASGQGFDGGTSITDVDASSDLALFAVLRTADIVTNNTYAFSKSDFSGGAGWTIQLTTNKALSMQVSEGSGLDNATATTAAGAVPLNEWCVIGVVFERATNKLRVGVRSLSTGATVVSAEVDAALVGSISNLAAPFRFCRGGLVGGELRVAAYYVATGAGAATGMSANLSTALANFAASFGTWTSTSGALGVWCPDAAMDVGESDPRRAPRVTDLRTTTSPTGNVKGLFGSGFYRHKNVTWPLVPENRVWEQAADIPNGSWETFFGQTQLGEGAWFEVSSPIQIYDQRGNRVGQDADVDGWQITGLNSIEPKRYQNFTGLWTIALPEIVSGG